MKSLLPRVVFPVILLIILPESLLAQRNHGSDLLQTFQELREPHYKPQCANADQINELKRILLSDQRNAVSDLPQCATTDQVNELKALIQSGQRGSVKSGDSQCSTVSQINELKSVLQPVVGCSFCIEDAALYKQSYQSSTYQVNYDRYAPGRAVDGNAETFSHTNADANSWWMVDLGAERLIYLIEILPRQICCPERYYNVELRIGSTRQSNGDFSSHTLLNIYKGPYSFAQGTLVYTFCKGITGRYLSLKAQQTYLHVADVKVFAQKI